MSYRIKRECWNEKTYNGYTDNPYWRIDLENGLNFGLTDKGDIWCMNIGYPIDDYIKGDIRRIIKECKLNIKPDFSRFKQ